MHTVTHAPLSAKTGEPVRIVFTVTDLAGEAVALDGADAVYRLARRAGEAAILEVSSPDGIMLGGNTAEVEFDTNDIADAGGPLTGDFTGQLTVTKDGAGLVVAEGIVRVSLKVSAPA